MGHTSSSSSSSSLCSSSSSRLQLATIELLCRVASGCKAFAVAVASEDNIEGVG
ncbi:hypothetical protein Scep_001074 [Stephania cephalantha]|uniref:Uncharacterized protein n=1 Tax=Stephania cephalantha TaxID=152367 RepID=A0AAP0L7A9_9MAGN